MNNPADICRECELPRKTRELEAENAELKERSRWRDAEKELPSYHYPAERDKPTIEFLVITDPYVVELFSGQYNPKSKEYIMERGFPITGGPDVVYWRPFSMPEYRNCVAGTKRKYPLDLSEALESEGGSGMSETLLSEAERDQLLQKVQLLEQAGTRLSNRLIDVLDNIIDESALLDALEKWAKAKEEAE